MKKMGFSQFFGMIYKMQALSPPPTIRVKVFCNAIKCNTFYIVFIPLLYCYPCYAPLLFKVLDILSHLQTLLRLMNCRKLLNM